MRQFQPEDQPAVLEMLRLSRDLPEDVRYSTLFSWKHLNSPFGPSPAWVALQDGEIIGYRAFMRWDFERSGRTVRAVRAVDTATHPQHRRKGVFRSLTQHALHKLRDEAVEFVFNTPNAQSLAGYVKMGWQTVGHLPVLVRPASLRGLIRMASANTAADRWSQPTDAGESAAEAFADRRSVADLLANLPSSERLSTHRTPDYLRWRYGTPELPYRVALVGSDLSAGCVVYRLRRRGSATEASICDVLAPVSHAKAAARITRRLARSNAADYGAMMARGGTHAGFLRLPGKGPLLVGRPITADAMPVLAGWYLSLGDIEVF